MNEHGRDAADVNYLLAAARKSRARAALRFIDGQQRLPEAHAGVSEVTGVRDWQSVQNLKENPEKMN